MSKSFVYEVRSGNEVFDFVVQKDGDLITEAIPAHIEQFYVGKKYREVLQSMRRVNPSITSRFVAAFS